MGNSVFSRSLGIVRYYATDSGLERNDETLRCKSQGQSISSRNRLFQGSKWGKQWVCLSVFHYVYCLFLPPTASLEDPKTGSPGGAEMRTQLPGLPKRGWFLRKLSLCHGNPDPPEFLGTTPKAGSIKEKDDKLIKDQMVAWGGI